jgi:putative endonuclease
MASVYILYSTKLDNFYIGSCLEFEDRLLKHNKNIFKNSFTSRADDWKTFLTIDNLQFKQARNIEKHIKRMKSSSYIKNLVKYSEIIQKLKVKYNIESS